MHEGKQIEVNVEMGQRIVIVHEAWWETKKVNVLARNLIFIYYQWISCMSYSLKKNCYGSKIVEDQSLKLTINQASETTTVSYRMLMITKPCQ